MSPAVAAALAKAQTNQNIQVISEKWAAGNNELEHEMTKQVNAVCSNLGKSVSLPSSPDLRKNMNEHDEQIVEAHHDLKEQSQASIAAQTIIESHHSSYEDVSTDASHVIPQFEENVEDPLQCVDPQNGSDLRPISISRKHDGEKGDLRAETSHQDLRQVAVNPLQQLVMLLNFNDNRYGDDDLDAAQGHCLISTLQNMEIGGSNSHDEFTSNSARENCARSSPEYPIPSRPLTCLRLEPPILIEESSLNSTKVNFHLKDNECCNITL